jgi:hypothetical protein
MGSPTPTDFTVRFSTEVARVLQCDDATGRIEFTVDAGSKGDRSICLEHHPASWPRGPRYELAFHRAKQFLESCGYEVEIYGE